MLQKTLKAFLMIPLVSFVASGATISVMDTDVINNGTQLSFDVAQFGGALADLNSVTVELMINGTADVTATNGTANPVNFQGTFQADFLLNGPVSFVNPILTATPMFTFGPQVIAPGASQAFNDTDNVTQGAGPFIAPGVLSDMTGAGTVNFTADVVNFLLGANVGPPFTLGLDSLGGDAKLTVTYDFDDPVIPEPMSLYLMSGGLLALGLLRLRRKS